MKGGFGHPFFKTFVMEKLDLSKDQFLMSIRLSGKDLLGYIESKDGKIVTSGVVGEKRK